MILLHTNDFHHALTPERMERLRAMKPSGAILLDAGDIVGSGNIGIPLRPDPIWQMMRLAGYDAVAMGNREFHVTERGLRAKLRGAPCPVLCANLYSKTGRPLPVVPSVMLAASTRIAVFGLTVPMVTPRMKTSALSRYLFRSPIEAAREQAADLRPKCDILVALTHIGHRQDLALAEAIPEIDIIVGGHSHTILMQPVVVGRTLILQAGSHARYVGTLNFQSFSDYTYTLAAL